MPKPQPQAAMVATNALTIDVENMEKADRKAKQEQAKSKKKKRSTKSKGGGPAKRNNKGKKVVVAAVWAILLMCSLGTSSV